MNRIKATMAALVIPLVLLTATEALARGGHGHFGGHRHFHRGHAGVGVLIAAPLFWPWYGAPSYYYPPVVAAPSSPPVYVERGDDLAAQSPSNDWYYCAESEGYYPYVKECPGGWQRVPPRSSVED